MAEKPGQLTNRSKYNSDGLRLSLCLSKTSGQHLGRVKYIGPPDEVDMITVARRNVLYRILAPKVQGHKSGKTEIFWWFPGRKVLDCPKRQEKHGLWALLSTYGSTLPHMCALRVKSRPWSQNKSPRQKTKWLVQTLHHLRCGIYRVCRLQKCNNIVWTPNLSPILLPMSWLSFAGSSIQ